MHDNIESHFPFSLCQNRTKAANCTIYSLRRRVSPHSMDDSIQSFALMLQPSPSLQIEFRTSNLFHMLLYLAARQFCLPLTVSARCFLPAAQARLLSPRQSTPGGDGLSFQNDAWLCILSATVVVDL